MSANEQRGREGGGARLALLSMMHSVVSGGGVALRASLPLKEAWRDQTDRPLYKGGGPKRIDLCKEACGPTD